jgi:hypothetical protein
MSDVNTFIDAIGKDVNATVAPRIEGLGKDIETKVRDFATSLIQEVFQRYQPELAGELRTKIVKGGIEVVGHGVRLDLKHRDTGTLVSSLDIPVSLTIRVDAVPVTLMETTIGLDVVR